MGLRGINAKPLSIRKRSGKPAWMKAGLGRLERIVCFVEALPVTSGALAGKKFKLRSWQHEILKGMYRTVNGKRVVREVLITMPRKNGKTGLIAALTLCHLCGPEAVPRGQVYSAAAERKQAALLFDEMKAIIAQVPWLERRCNVRDFTKDIEDIETGSKYIALSADAKSKHGFSASFWVYDELAQAHDRKLYDVLSTSTGARREPLGIVISTQSSDPKHIMSERVDYARQVRDGVIEDPSFYGCIYTAPDDADPWDERTWHACNPALGDFRSLQEMRDYAVKAQRIPEQETAFRLFYLNQRFSPAELRYIPRPDWDACGIKSQAEVDALAELLKGRPCYGGLDLSEKNDLTAFVLAFPFDEHVVALPFFWTRQDGIDDRGAKDRAAYALWARQGHLRTTPGKVIDYEYVASAIAELTAPYELKAVACDPWQIDKFNQALSDVGAHQIQLFKHGQGFKDLDPAVRTLEDLALAWRLQHPNNPVLTWCMDNVRLLRDAAGNRKFDKKNSTGRIDGVVALAMALNLAASQNVAPDYQMLFV
jgi:phage terminase large subunit-like protein